MGFKEYMDRSGKFITEDEANRRVGEMQMIRQQWLNNLEQDYATRQEQERSIRAAHDEDVVEGEAKKKRQKKQKKVNSKQESNSSSSSHPQDPNPPPSNQKMPPEGSLVNDENDDDNNDVVVLVQAVPVTGP